MSKVIMVQGTMSNAGKSLIVAGLCRIFRQDGYRVAPFKSQNMALNSYITEEGLEMGRAQVMQAEAAGIKPSALMNPILLKPTNNVGSQVIVGGEVLGNMSAREYFSYKKKLIPHICRAFTELEKQADIIVIEGAGSPAEINLKEDDIVNMGLAELVDAPVLLVGDIDLGGVFAQLLGTLMLLEEKERSRVKGLVINKFRGDQTILDPGVEMLKERGGVAVVGVVPYIQLALEDEDSMSVHLRNKKQNLIDLAVIRLPRISNFTDFNVFEQLEDVSVRYVSSVRELGNPDMIFLPGSKNTMGDLKWMRQNGLEAAVKKLAENIPIWGICGGYQMLGQTLSDPLCLEEGGQMRGMELLPAKTELKPQKMRTQVRGCFGKISGIFSELSGMELSGYEIHMGQTKAAAFGGHFGDEAAESEDRLQGVQANTEGKRNGIASLVEFTSEKRVFAELREDGMYSGNVYGSYVHGIFDSGRIAVCIVEALARNKGIEWKAGTDHDYHAFKESQYDKLAHTLRDSMDINYVYSILQEAGI